MHPNFHFSALQILWTFTFAAQLVLLVVLMGRDRLRRYPWFSLSILLMALRLMASRLLYGRMASVTLSGIFIVMAALAAIVGFLVLVEMARRAFVGAKRNVWLAVGAGALVVGVGVLAKWGPWPAWQTLKPESALGYLRLLQFGAQKLDMLVDLLTVELGLLVVLLGRRFAAGWRSHTQRIVIGLSTASIAQLGIEVVWQLIAKSAQPHSQAEYERVVGLRDKLFNANGALYVVILVWFIAVLWKDEPGEGAKAPAALPEPEYIAPESETAGN
jgi:hypothetical protein